VLFVDRRLLNRARSTMPFAQHSGSRPMLSVFRRWLPGSRQGTPSHFLGQPASSPWKGYTLNQLILSPPRPILFQQLSQRILYLFSELSLTGKDGSGWMRFNHWCHLNLPGYGVSSIRKTGEFSFEVSRRNICTFHLTKVNLTLVNVCMWVFNCKIELIAL